MQKDLVKKEKWIIDGNYSGTLDIRLNSADTIIFLDIHRTICMYRAFKRMLLYRNKTRPDMGEACEERFDLAFFKWIWDYPKTKRPEIVKRLEQFSNDKNIFVLKSPKEVQKFLKHQLL